LRNTSIHFGVNESHQIAEHVKGFNSSKVLIVTDNGILEAGHLDPVVNSLNESEINYEIYTNVKENPSTDDVDECVDFAKNKSIDLIIGLGGGSSLDTAKGVNFILTNGGSMHDYRGVGKATREMLPFIAIPTTAGTGSECQSFAIISDSTSHEKMACGDLKAAARIAILDPALTTSQPRRISAHTGIDAISHAVETLVTKKRTDDSIQYSRLAFSLLNRSFEKIVNDPNDLDARSDMLLGAAYAGTAIECSMLGSAHASANPLTAKFSIPHGAAVGLMLPHVIKYNSSIEEISELYNSLSEESLSDRITRLLKISNIPSKLGDYGIKKESFKDLANEASGQWTGNFNPKQTDHADFMNLYESAL
jgi:alcohol dehydrogenase